MTNQQMSSDEPDQMLPPVQTTTDDTVDQNSQQTVPSQRALIPLPNEAADTDLIEKEWVEKAKQIVDHTAGDPFLQVEELNRVRADYMKKRYNKDLG